MSAKKVEEFKATHRIIDRHGFDIGEEVMKVGDKYFTVEAWFHNEKPETDETLKNMGWHVVSSFRELVECFSCRKMVSPSGAKFFYCDHCGNAVVVDR